MVRLSNAGYRKLRGFWANLSCVDTGVNWEPTELEELLFTDSSGFGYGASLFLDTQVLAHKLLGQHRSRVTYHIQRIEGG